MERKGIKRKHFFSLLCFLFLLLWIAAGQKLYAEPSQGLPDDSEQQEPAKPGEETVSLPAISAEDIHLSEAANENGWISKDTIFTVELPNDEASQEPEQEQAELPEQEPEQEPGQEAPRVVVEYKKQEADGWTAMDADASNPRLFTCMETDDCYDGAYQFRTRDDSGNTMPEEQWITIPFQKDKLAPTVRISLDEPDSESENGKYYGGSGGACESVLLTFAENFFEKQTDDTGEPRKPELLILRDGVPVEQQETKDWILWSSLEGENTSEGISAKVELPYEDGEEICYQVEAVYRDAAGNPLALEEGSGGQCMDPEEGRVTTGRLILDARPPELLAFAAEGEYVKEVDREGSKVPLYKNTDGPDITFTFTIDAEEDWEREFLKLEIVNQTENRTVVSVNGEDDRLTWSREGRRHTAVFDFDGEEGKECVYALRLSCKDRAGNLLRDGRSGTEGKESVGEMDEKTGSFVSGPFFLDHAVPLLGVTYSEAVRLVKDGVDYEASRTPVEGCTSYYNGEIEVSITLRDALAESVSAEDERQGPEGFRFEMTGEEADSQTALPAIQWSRQEDYYFGKLRISAEGDYRLKLSYSDAAGNPAAADESGEILVQGTLRNGGYESPLLIVDRTPPVISLEYSEQPKAAYGEKKYFDKAVTLRLKVEDRNFRVGELKENLLEFTAEDGRGKDRTQETSLLEAVMRLPDTKISRESWSAELLLDTEANYQIPIAFTDLAGNPAVLAGMDGAGEQSGVHKEYPVVDRTPPSGLELTGTPGEAVNYLPSRWLFSMEKMELQALAEDTVAGIREIRFVLTGEDGKEMVQSQSFWPSAEGKAAVKIPSASEIVSEGSALPAPEDFKGTVRVEVYDWAGNCLAEERSCAVESEERHKAAGGAEIAVLTEPSRTVDGTDYYNTDVELQLTLHDTFSGLKSVEYEGGAVLSGSRNFAAEAGKSPDGTPEQEITYEFTERLTLDAFANNRNQVLFEASYTDNAGHTGKTEQSFAIDVTPPEITVEYDLNEPENERYYRQPRTAVVTIREQNFDERDVEWEITNTEGKMPRISGWSSAGEGDDALHTCTVVFEEDGDYTFTLAFQDLAGNRAVYAQTDTFTIDRTAPELRVSWDNEDARSGYYYAADRTAVLDLLEHNFDPNQIEVIVTAEWAEGQAQEEARQEKSAQNEPGPGLPSVSAWSRDGDHSTASVTFSRDGIYTLTVRGRDLAGNELAEYRTEAFVIDQTPPELAVFDIADRSANSGEVSPGIRYSDTNLDPEATEIVLNGYQNGETDWEGVYQPLENGMEIKLQDFAHVQELDDLYTLRASVTDLAGNRSEAQVSFSVNRFGSVYTFDEKTERLAGKNGSFYTRQAQDIVVTETNVDTLEFREILLSRDGKLRTLEEGNDYTVKESGDAPGWKQYTYTIDRKNFQEEGVYLLTLYSEDRAENVSDTGSKGKRLEFAIDRTAPVVLISGAEDGGRYREGARTLTLDVQDNLSLREMTVSLDGKETVYGAAELEEKGGRIVLRIKGENHWQELRVTARDAAGNESRVQTLRLLVTPNLLVQFLMNKPLLYGTAGALFLAEAGAYWGIRRRHSRAMKPGGQQE